MDRSRNELQYLTVEEKVLIRLAGHTPVPETLVQRVVRETISFRSGCHEMFDMFDMLGEDMLLERSAPKSAISA